MEILTNNNIMAIIPIYENDLGNVTKVYFESTEAVTIEKSIKTVFSYLLKYYMVNVDEIRRSYHGLLGSKNLMPIPFSREDVFIPAKIRIPLTKNDGAFGYINIRYIKKILDRGDFLEVTLGDEKLQVLSKMTTFKKHITQGNVIRECYIERKFHKSLSYDDIVLSAKEELLFLREEILNISKNL